MVREAFKILNNQRFYEKLKQLHLNLNNNEIIKSWPVLKMHIIQPQSPQQKAPTPKVTKKL